MLDDPGIESPRRGGPREGTGARRSGTCAVDIVGVYHDNERKSTWCSMTVRGKRKNIESGQGLAAGGKQDQSATEHVVARKDVLCE